MIERSLRARGRSTAAAVAIVAGLLAIADSETGARLWPVGWLLFGGALMIVAALARAAKGREQELMVTLERDPQRSPFGKRARQMLFDEKAEIREAPKHFSDFFEWARSRGASDLNRSAIRLTLEAAGEQAVVITGLSAKIVGRTSAPDRGIPICRPTAGQITIRAVTLRLDDDVSSGLEHPLSVSRTDPEVVDIEALARSGDFEWRLSIDYTVGGRKQSLTVPDEPIRTVGATTVVQYEWPFIGYWVKSDRRTSTITELDPGEQLHAVAIGAQR